MPNVPSQVLFRPRISFFERRKGWSNHRSAAAESFTFPHPEVFFLNCTSIFLPELHAFVLAGYFGHDSIVLCYLQWLKSSKDLRNVDKRLTFLWKQKKKTYHFTYRLTLQKLLKSALIWHHILIFMVALPVILGIVITFWVIFRHISYYFFSLPKRLGWPLCGPLVYNGSQCSFCGNKSHTSNDCRRQQCCHWSVGW